MSSTPSNEMFYVDADGNKCDASLHADKLASVEGNRRADWAAVDQWMVLGKTKAEAIQLVFGDNQHPGDTDHGQA